MAHRLEQQSRKDGDQGSSGTIITPDNPGATQSSGARSQDRGSDAGERQSSAGERQTPGRSAQTGAAVAEGQSDRELEQQRSGLPMAWPVSPFGMMNRMFEEMDRFFEDFGFGRNRLMPRMRDIVGEGQRGLGGMWSPQIEVSEREGRLVICADLPGLRKDDVRVELGEDALTIRGERREEQSRAGYSERFYGNFYRRIPLPEGVDAGDAQARFQDGVLEVSVPLPKRESGGRRQLEIR